MRPYCRYAIAVCLFILFAVAASAQAIYKTPSGKKYHLATCHTVKNVSEKITLQEARDLGLEPCKVCKPPVDQLLMSPENKAQGQSTSVQCRGITKKGTRCRHTTKIANGFCFQHQPKG